jgi:hypothetical protein
MLASDDAFLESLDRWKKRAISAFALLSLLIAMLVALVIELAALADVVQSKFHAGLPVHIRAIHSHVSGCSELAGSRNFTFGPEKQRSSTNPTSDPSGRRLVARSFEKVTQNPSQVATPREQNSRSL